MLERITRGRTDLVFEYLSIPGAKTSDSNGVTLLQWCAYYGDVSALRYLLDRGDELTSLVENLGLNAAAFHGHWQLCEFLLERGAGVNYPLPATGETPLHAALCKANRPAYELVVGVLLDAGANPNIATRPGVETDGFMRDCKTKGETPLHRAAAFASDYTVQCLLDAGASIDAKDIHGDSPLTWASWHLRPDSILRRLLYGGQTIHPERSSASDHGTGWGAMDLDLLGRPGGFKK